MSDRDKKQTAWADGDNTMQALSDRPVGTALLIGGLLAGVIGAAATWAWARKRNKKAAR
jgi:hypothetical protein